MIFRVGVVVNDAELCDIAVKAADGIKVVPSMPALTGDDFAFYKEMLGGKSLYLKVGTGVSEMLHHPSVIVDPAAIKVTGDYLTNLLLQALST